MLIHSHAKPFATGRLVCRRVPAHVTTATRRRNVTVCQAAVGTQLSLHVGETTITVPFAAEQAQQLTAGFNKLLQTFSDKQKAERPKRWEMMEVKFKGDSTKGELEYMELFCNPNAYPTAFDAKLLITIRGSGGIQVTTEGRLSAIKSDLDAFLSQAS
eukprot:jgi/Chrzof1/14872/Cz09g19030.t1